MPVTHSHHISSFYGKLGIPDGIVLFFSFLSFVFATFVSKHQELDYITTYAYNWSKTL